MISDLERSDIPAGNTFDVCVVGSGAAGLTISHQLFRRGHRVLLLEGGGASRWERKSQALNKSDLHGQTFAGAHSGRFRTLGGTTSVWAGQVMELDDIDFEHRDWVEGSSWPIGKSELRKYYAQATELEGAEGLVQDDAEVWERTGTPQPDLGEELHISFSRYCPEKKFARVFADTINDERLTVMLHANAVEMIPAQNNQQIASLRLRTLDGKETFCKAKNFVLCLGGIESSRFLLNQQFSPWNASNLVGRYFQDHIQCFAADVRHADMHLPNWAYGPYRLAGNYLPKIRLSAAAQQKYQVLNVSGMVEPSDGIYETLRTGIKVVAGPSSTIGLGEFLRMTPRVPAVIWHHFKIKKDPNYIVPWAKPKLSVYCEQSPVSESRIVLSSKRDKLGLFKADITWCVSELEIETVRKYVAVAQEAFKAFGIGEIVPDPDLHNDGIYRKCTDQFHHCGGTRMAARTQDGVVDLDLRLNGVGNVYVCSSSVFPCSGFANPTHTIIALAARLAEHLDRKLAEGATS